MYVYIYIWFLIPRNSRNTQNLHANIRMLTIQEPCRKSHEKLRPVSQM